MHRQNQAEHAICTFKDHFLAILAGVDTAFLPYLWDLLLPQAELTLNLLHQVILNSRISAWEFFQRPFDFNKTPLGPLVVASSSMQSRLLGNRGTSAQNQASILALPSIPTAASS